MSNQRPPAPADSRARARALRTRSTDAERLLRHHLRDRRMSGFKFRRQHPIAGYHADFACVEAGLVVELDGGQHFEPEAQAADQRRTAALQHAGYTVLRFHNGHMLKETEAVLSVIHDRLAAHTPQTSLAAPQAKSAHSR